MKLLFSILITVLIFAKPSFGASIIRDTEIEHIIWELTRPLLRNADLSEEQLNIYLINDQSINAFVSGGQNVFLNTGLLTRSNHPSVLVGVMAHELGHISGGHLLQLQEEVRQTITKSIIGYALGIAAAAAGSPEAGQAIIAGGAQVAQRQFLKHTRTNEEAADQFAIDLLAKTNYPLKGLRDLLTVLQQRQNTIHGDLNPYALTHPLGRERIRHIDAFVAQTGYKGHIDEHLVIMYKRAIVKLAAYLNPPEATLAKYPASDLSDNARYARSIAYYKIPDIEKALEEINRLLEMYPDDPFYHELKGQILFENGRLRPSIINYREAVTLLPTDPLLKIQLATALNTTEDNQYAQESVTLLKQALVREKNHAFAWRQLAIAYGRNDQVGLSNLALAEEALLRGKEEQVKSFITKARELVDEGSPSSLRIDDIEASLKELKKNKK